MEGIVNIKKSKEDIARCKKIVADILLEDLNDNMLEGLTVEVMDTSLFIGGDFSDDTIRELAIQYQLSGGVTRYKNSHRGE